MSYLDITSSLSVLPNDFSLLNRSCSERSATSMKLNAEMEICLHAKVWLAQMIEGLVLSVCGVVHIALVKSQGYSPEIVAQKIYVCFI
jgi:succinate dehydrogenase hydrophobic anchor subunit